MTNESWNKKFLFLSKEWIFEIKLLELVILSLDPIFRKKSQVEIGRFDLKSRFYII